MTPIQLSDHFNYRRLLRFVLPSIIMMIFTSVYSVVDGLYVSNYVGKTPFAAVNLIMPFIMGMGALGFMIGTGGSALTARLLGEGEHEEANRCFSMLIAFTCIVGILLSVLGFVFIRPISIWLGADSAMLEGCVVYGRVLLVFQTPFMLQCVFQSFFITAEKPRLGLWITVIAGVANIVLDALFIGCFRWGLVGAAAATGIGELIGSVFPVFYFLRRKNGGLLRLTRPRWNAGMLMRTCTNGASELMTNLSMSIVNILYNAQLIRLAGENGVAVYGVLMYVNFIFVAIFIGYSIGCAPIISYHLGAGNADELKNIFRKSILLISICALAMTLSAELTAAPISRVFVGYDSDLMAMTQRGFRLYSISFLFTGFNIFGSAFFTALNNGAVSAAISFLRTLVFQIFSVLLLSALFGLDGIWLAVTVAELAALAVTFFFVMKEKTRYHYL